MNPLMRAVIDLVSSRAGTWLFLRVAPPVDRLLLRLSSGRASLSLGLPILLLTTQGARTGQPRSSPLLYVADGERVALIASNGGRPRHPSWYHNLRANPEVTLTLRGETRRYRAREAGRAERQRLWAKAVAQYPGYATYEQRTGGRPIPVIVLEPL